MEHVALALDQEHQRFQAPRTFIPHGFEQVPPLSAEVGDEQSPVGLAPDQRYHFVRQGERFTPVRSFLVEDHRLEPDELPVEVFLPSLSSSPPVLAMTRSHSSSSREFSSHF
jgi:hypothetical protein